MHTQIIQFLFLWLLFLWLLALIARLCFIFYIMSKTYMNPVNMTFQELGDFIFPQSLLRARAEAVSHINRGPTEFLTIMEAAELVKVSERTMREWIAKYKVPTIRIDGVIRLRRDKFLAALDKYEIRAV